MAVGEGGGAGTEAGKEPATTADGTTVESMWNERGTTQACTRAGSVLRCTDAYVTNGSWPRAAALGCTNQAVR